MKTALLMIKKQLRFVFTVYSLFAKHALKIIRNTHMTHQSYKAIRSGLISRELKIKKYLKIKCPQSSYFNPLETQCSRSNGTVTDVRQKLPVKFV